MRLCHVFVGLHVNDQFKGTYFLFSRKLLLCNMLVSIQHFKACQNFTHNSKKKSTISSKIILLRNL